MRGGENMEEANRIDGLRPEECWLDLQYLQRLHRDVYLIDFPLHLFCLEDEIAEVRTALLED